MIKFDEIKMIYTCASAPPQGVFMNRLYTIGKDSKGFYFTDGNYVEHVKDNLDYLKMLFSLHDKNLTWKDVDFGEVKYEKVTK